MYIIASQYHDNLRLLMPALSVFGFIIVVFVIYSFSGTNKWLRRVSVTAVAAWIALATWGSVKKANDMDDYVRSGKQASDLAAVQSAIEAIRSDEIRADERRRIEEEKIRAKVREEVRREEAAKQK